MADFQQQKQIVRDMFAQQAKADASNISNVISSFVAKDYTFYGCYPFDKMDNVTEVVSKVWQPIYSAFSHLQRREDVFIAGENAHDDKVWVMSMGHFMGLFDQDWLGMRATQKTTMLRYAEFHCVQHGKITHSSFFVDLIGFMQQIGLNPMPAQTAANFLVPGPRTHDGLHFTAHPQEQANITLALVNKMVDDLTALNKSGNDNCPPEVLAQSWTQDMVWYGPAGIGTVHSIERYQQQHQYPFRHGLKDKVFNGHISRFAEGNYACFFGWPNLSNKAKGGWLGLPGGNVQGDMRVVDVYRREGNKLAENWVIIDVPYWLKQQGLDILKRTTGIENPSPLN